ncbi:MAG: YicC family protein [Paludibacteraceae bacterium]|nr:YicC family protein [Paludibacteraceae bacterium]
MILSMTGYGKAEYNFADHKTIVEIRSLNSKQLDLNLKIASLFRDKEPEIRAMLTAPLERGKVDVSIYTQTLDGTASADTFAPINKEAFAYYYHELTDLQQSLGMPGNQDLIGAILRIPGVIQLTAGDVNISDDEWNMLQGAIRDALQAFRAFRVQEGAALQTMFTAKLDGIAQLLAEVEPYEKDRVANIKRRLMDNLSQIGDKGCSTDKKVSVAYDQNRLEAELIYYLEKLDITEEKVRLTNHIRYFRETMQSDGTGVGKKLGFIAQEMGREINTLGSKSNQSEMQILDVRMKDILEQIKEQVLNVL